MRIYWKHIDNWSEEDMHIFLRCDEFSLEDTLKLLALTKKVDYVRAASDPIAPSMKYCYSEFVLGSVTCQCRMVGWHQQLDGHEFEQALGIGDGQGSLAWKPGVLQSMGWQRVGHNWSTELN